MRKKEISAQFKPLFFLGSLSGDEPSFVLVSGGASLVLSLCELSTK
jgi:hypothetical protein